MRLKRRAKGLAGLLTVLMLAFIQREQALGAVSDWVLYFSFVISAALWAIAISPNGCAAKALAGIGYLLVFYGVSTFLLPFAGLPESIKAGWGFQAFFALIALVIGLGLLTVARAQDPADSVSEDEPKPHSKT